MVRWNVRFLSIVCLVSLLLSVAIIDTLQANAQSTPCVSDTAPPTVVGIPIIPPTDQPSVVLNEILPNPRAGWNCADQNNLGPQQNAWIELYNLLDQPLDLYGARTCIDGGSDASQYCLTMGSTIPAHGFFTFFPHLANNYILTPEMPTLRLLLNYSVVDQVNLPTLPRDVSYARIPDGTGKWQLDIYPTINGSNSILPSPTPTHLSTKKGTRTTTTHTNKKSTRSTRTGEGDNTIQNVIADDSHRQQNNGGRPPQWQALLFPTSLASPSAISTVGNMLSTSSSSPEPAQNVPQKMLFSLLGIAGLLSLWWGWRRFFKKRQ